MYAARSKPRTPPYSADKAAGVSIECSLCGSLDATIVIRLRSFLDINERKTGSITCEQA